MGTTDFCFVNELTIPAGDSFCHLELMWLFILWEIAEMSIVEFFFFGNIL